jgi:tetratricopeptide (TPR) repeat protein
LIIPRVGTESDIPDYLSRGPTGEPPPPPVDTSAQQLPFEGLPWEDFERLCLRLARHDGTPEHVRAFGTRGQAQGGIDVYSRTAAGTYTVYQCKLYSRLTPADIRAAVSRFLDGEWAGRARQFVLCTNKSLTPAQLALEVERQAQRLRERNPPIAFVVWDADELSSSLKEHPQLVRDFFGHAWFERFVPTEHVGVRLPVPRQLPPALGEFVNRERDLVGVDSVIARHRSPGAAPVVMLTGGHGVGKTATSRRWAHANSDRFSDGQLYADFSMLRYRGGVGVGDVLGGFLRAFGVPNEVIPAALEERSALFRSSTAGKRLLVLLDDVDHPAQVRPLIPGTAHSAVVVTTRAALEELVVYEGAKRVRLKPLTPDSAEELLACMVGEERVDAEPAAVERLVRICAGLPVALRICGSRLAIHESRPVSWLVEQLAGEDHRLERIGTEPEQSLQVVFDDTYRALDPDAATTYRRLGLHPGPSFTVAAAAAAAGLPARRAPEAFDRLLVAHLVEDLGDRFMFHDLLRIHARGVGRRDESADEKAAAVHRTVAFYLRTAQRMDHAMIPIRLRLTEGPPPPVPGEPAPSSPAEAFTLFEAERPNLVAALRAAVEREWDSEAWQMGEALFLAYHNHKHYEEALEIFELATQAARRAGHLEAEVRMLSQLALAHLDMGDDATADAQLATCRSLMEESSNRELWASIREWTGTLEVQRGNYPQAISAYEQARSAFEVVGNPRGVALQDLGMGHALNLSGDHRRAVECLLQAAELIDAEVDGLTFGRVLVRLGEAYSGLGDLGKAKQALRDAVEVMRQHDAPLYEARARESLAQIEHDEGDTQAAVSNLKRALSIYSLLRSPQADQIGARLDELGS